MIGIAVVTSDRPPKRRRFNEDKYSGLLGNRVDGGPQRDDRESSLMTVRRDLLSIRESILTEDWAYALSETDWLLDQIENKLSEKC